MRNKFILLTILFYAVQQPVNADNAEDEGCKLAKELHINPAYRAMAQWERVFSSERKMKRYKINSLTPEQQKELKSCLINHAIDSEQPTIAGDFS